MRKIDFIVDYIVKMHILHKHCVDLLIFLIPSIAIAVSVVDKAAVNASAIKFSSINVEENLMKCM